MKDPVPQPVMFDPQRRAASKELQSAVASLAAYLEQHEAALGLRKKARKDTDRKSFRLAVEAIACNLAALPLLSNDRPLAVPRSSGMMWAKGRYRDPVYGQHFLDALDLMARPEVGFAEVLTRGYKFKGGQKGQSTIKPTAAFNARLSPFGNRWDAFGRAEEPEVLILKGLKHGGAESAEAIDYLDTRQTRRMRKEVQRINAYLRQAPLTVIGQDGGPIGTDDDDRPIDPSQRSVRRIFNNGDWQQGGRLFDGFWETMRREDRFRLLRIRTAALPEGERIANVDFSQLFPRLAYQWVKQEPPEGDLYDLIGGGVSREGFKKLLNSLLFADRPLTRWPRKTSSLFPDGTKLRDAIALIRNSHQPIAHLFGTGIGYRFMFVESNILIEALIDLFASGITALPLHDSVLVAASDAEAAKAIMENAFERATGESRGKLKVDFGLQSQ
jgi:hypothetical protein